MNTNKVITAGIAGVALVLSLTACGAHSTIQGQHVPSATDTAVATSTASATPTAVNNGGTTGTTFTVDASKVAVPDAVKAAYPDTTNLVTDTLAVASLANEAKDLQHQRTGDEQGYWAVYKPVMTPEAWTRVQDNVKAAVAGDAGAVDRLNGLQPYTNRDGSLATVNGVAYSAGDKGIRVDIVGVPTVELVKDSTYGQYVSVKVPEKVSAYTNDGHVLTFTMVKALFMVPGADGHWVLDGYAPLAVSAMTAEAAK